VLGRWDHDRRGNIARLVFARPALHFNGLGLELGSTQEGSGLAICGFLSRRDQVRRGGLERADIYILTEHYYRHVGIT